MKISFENADKVNGQLTIVVEEADYNEKVEKTLKDYRKKANIPGFRPGQAPLSLIKKQVGEQVKMDELNKLVGETIYSYLKDNNIQFLGEPLPSAKQEAQDLAKPAPYTFVFDIAVAPEIDLELTDKDKLDYYEITVDDKLVDEQVDMFASRAGKYEQVEKYQAKDMLKGDMKELNADGSEKEGGIVKEGAVLMPEYIKVDDQKKLFKGLKRGQVVVFNPKKAFPESEIEVSSMLGISKEEAANVDSDFAFHVLEITRYAKAPVNQELFDAIYGEGAVKDEADFRSKIAEGIANQLVSNSEFKLIQDLRAYCEKKVGKLVFPEEMLKRVMRTKVKDAKEVDEKFDASLEELKWHLIKERLVKANDVKVNDDDVLDAARLQARIQFAQYGMSNLPDETVDNYAREMLKNRETLDGFVDRAVENKLVEALKKVVKLKKKKVSLDDFNKMMEEDAKK
ncbi:trigger factor [Hoylesella loescheii]|uniref:Trigger factor n=1 Tax=Hoylesella loescheii DSM 19665 = JCM 12249 = ATCC 15930 TaxID=1122985 RepID=A0A069QEN5_HOYLO|nr:trigger factor [Hoylesella loescheii]KDR51348.1 trigger factor [Hoylesella loescheii DSM 19665 = JCM 12249 = ATCC 15930]